MKSRDSVPNLVNRCKLDSNPRFPCLIYSLCPALLCREQLTQLNMLVLILHSQEFILVNIASFFWELFQCCANTEKTYFSYDEFFKNKFPPNFFYMIRFILPKF